MKKYSLVFLFFLTIITSCEKFKTNDQTSKPPEIEGEIKSLNISFTGEKISYNNTLSAEINKHSLDNRTKNTIEASLNKDETYKININKAGNTITMYAISLNYPRGSIIEEGFLIIYVREEKSLLAITSSSKADRGIRQLNFKDINNSLYFSAELDKEGQLGNFQFKNEFPINKVFNNGFIDKPENLTESDDCGDLNLTSCVACLANECGQSFACTIVWRGYLAPINPLWLAIATYGCSG